MENEPPHSAPATSTTGSRQTNTPLPVYSGIPDRQTVQVIQQALTRQPSTAAQYLQQMYAAQQQHLMLQTAALQQQHLNSAQLQSLAAAQQASLAGSRASPAVSVSQQSAPQSPAINLTSSPQIIQRPQTISSTPPAAPAITQQTVLLGNAASPSLSASQAQMYLRAQMLIFTPTAAVSSIQSEVSSGATSQPPTISTQVQNLAVRGPGGTAGGLSQTQLPSLAMKPTTISMNLHPVSSTSQSRSMGHIRGDSVDIHRKGDSQGAESRVLAGRTVIPAHSIITPAFSPQLVHQQKQIQHHFTIQNQPHIQPRPVLPVTQISAPRQPLTHQPQLSQCLCSPPITSQAQLDPPSTCVESNGHRPSPVLQLPQPCASLSEGTVQRRLLPPSSPVILQIPTAAGMDSIHKHCAPPQRIPSVSPSLIHIQPQPTLVAQATVSITQTPDLQKPLPHDPSPTCQPDPHSRPPLDMTSGNGSSPLPAAATGSATQNGESKPPQAVVKPQILTHVIEGFVIQEGAQPFPSHRRRTVLEVPRSPLLLAAQKYQQVLLPEKQPQQDNNTTTDSEMETFVPESKNENDPPKLKCELCGRVNFEYKFKRSKRFCSMACAKRYNVGCTKRVGLFHPDRSKLQKPGGPKQRRSRKGGLQNLGTVPVKQISESVPLLNPAPITASSNLKHCNSQEDSSRCSDNSSFEEPLSPVSVSSSLSRKRHSDRNTELPDLQGGGLLENDNTFLPSDPTKWNVEEVYQFIRSLPGCQEISEEFRAQEIDGQALLLLKEDHLMSTMNIKLGPALKIYARISMLKDS
ncbi:polyhomeotic-like protein 2 isoform X2 [Pseudophryne corroboree]|uniref:polyhomeotic-like protein 2 isoform X2 n=1 Tax=Pseudophryne corroboree TaxID=495146 RepID=UPI003081627D